MKKPVELVAVEKEIWKMIQARGLSLQDALTLFTRLLVHVEDTIRGVDGVLPEYEQIKSRYKHGS